MCRRQMIQFFAFLLLGWTCSTAEGLAQNNPYVYLVQIPTPKSQDFIVQTGFRLKGTKGIITCLHGVLLGIASGTKFSAVSDGETPTTYKGLTVSHVDVARDLSILRCAQLDKEEA